MAEGIYIYPYDETYVQIVSEDDGIMRELSAYFTYEVPGAQWSPKVRARIWDGKMRLFNKINQTLYKGLIYELMKFCRERSYFCKFQEFDDLLADIHEKDQGFTTEGFIQKLNLGVKPHFFQKDALDVATKRKRALFLSPTSSGKSLIIYMLIRYALERLRKGRKILLVVPTVNLVTQMLKEFREYAPQFPIDRFVHQIYEGQDKEAKVPIYISTWQSIYDMPKEYMHQFDCVIGDECHLLKAKSIKKIFENAINARLRFGLTGTLDNKECHTLVISGLTGPVHEVVEVKELIDKGFVSKPKINCMILRYPDCDRASRDWHGENEFIETHAGRNKVIQGIMKVTKGNTMVLTDKIAHISTLVELAKQTGKKVYVIAGSGDHKKDGDEREKIRQLFETIDDAILVCTFGTCSTGMSIKNIQHVIFASSSKSEIKVIQTIGRGLRLDGKTNTVTIWDIVDEFGQRKKDGSTTPNILVRHFFERVKIYKKVGYEYVIKNLNI